MKQRNLKTTFLLLAALAATSCSNETDPTLNPNANPDAVELGITAGVELTKSVIDGGDNAQSGTGANILQEVAVRATGDDYTSGNNKAIYSQSNGSWTNSGSDKIYLTAKVATIYAFHPVYTYDANGNKTSAQVTVSGTVGSGATIPVTLFTGGETEAAGGSSTLKANSTITDASDGKILSAPGEVDYLWEGSQPKPTASNGKGSGETTNKSVDLNMKHALSMVSFKIYKEDNYKGAGLLTKIVLKNKDNGTALKAEGATMNIQTGAVTVAGSTAATFTRLIKASASADGATLASTVDNAHSYSILVFPDAQAVAKNTIQAVFTIDGADYEKELATNETGVQWETGKNNTYTVKLSGTELTISSVKVAAWTDTSGGNLDIN